MLNAEKNEKAELIFQIAVSGYFLIISTVVIFLLASTFIHSENSNERLILTPFLLALITFFFSMVVSIRKALSGLKKLKSHDIPTDAEEELDQGNTLVRFTSILSTLASIAFYVFWFSFLTYIDYMMVKKNRKDIIIFTLIFWIAGIVSAVSTFRNDE